MQEYKNPLFTKGRAVKKESLDRLHDFSRDFTELAFAGDSDGILFGCVITFDKGNLSVSAGAVKLGGDIILLQEEELPFLEFEQLVSVKIAVKTKYRTEDFEVIPVEFTADSRFDLRKRELELGRFCLSKGAELRSQYNGVKDFKTPHNTLDLTHVLFSGIDKPTLSPKLLKQFAHELLSFDFRDNLDLTFGLLCMNSVVIQRDCILWYLSNRLQEPFLERTNEEIYDRLVRIAENQPVKQELKGSSRRGPNII